MMNTQQRQQPMTVKIGNSQVTKNRWACNPNDAVMLLIDHQTGLFQLVRDMEQEVLKSNVIALAKVAKLANIPTFTTASVPEGPNGPLIPEIHQTNPDAVYIPRTGQINAWDNPEWVKAIEKTGRKTLIMAGTLTSVCMTFPALSAVEAGYRVFCVVDASGNHSKMATELAIHRVSQAGCFPIDTMGLFSEVMATWNREDANIYAGLMMDHVLPIYKTIADFTKREAGPGAVPTQQKKTAQGEQVDPSLMQRLGKLTAGLEA